MVLLTTKVIVFYKSGNTYVEKKISPLLNTIYILKCLPFNFLPGILKNSCVLVSD